MYGRSVVDVWERGGRGGGGSVCCTEKVIRCRGEGGSEMREYDRRNRTGTGGGNEWG